MNNCFSIYHTSWITSRPKSNLIYDNIPTKAFSFLRLLGGEYYLTNHLWASHQRARKVLFTCVVYTKYYKYIPQKWIVLFAHADWLARRWLAKYHSPPSSRRKTKWLLSVYCQTKLLFGPQVIQLVWYILHVKQSFTSVSVKVVGIYFVASRLGKCPNLFTSTSLNNC